MRLEKIQNNKNLIGGVKCMLCEMMSNDLTSHITRMHCTIDEYKAQFSDVPFRSAKYLNEQSERISGDKNPAYQHGGKYSPFSEKFIKGKSQTIHEKVAKNREENQNTTTNLNCYLKRGLSQKDAELALSERQRTFSLDKCIKKFGVDEGTRIWKARQEKWLKNYPKGNYSKISQDLFWKIFDRLTDGEKKQSKFATLSSDGNRDCTGRNHEQVIENYRVDFILRNKIIEFDGDYWHSNKNSYSAKNTNKTRDEIRDSKLQTLGYSIFRVREHQYKSDSQKVINECICFLTTQPENS